MQQTKDLASDDGIIMSYESIRVDFLYITWNAEINGNYGLHDKVMIEDSNWPHYFKF